MAAVLGLWCWSEGTISVNSVTTPKAEAFYWTTITFSQTLGTALDDWMADTGGLGYRGGALVFRCRAGGSRWTVLLGKCVPRGARLDEERFWTVIAMQYKLFSRYGLILISLTFQHSAFS